MALIIHGMNVIIDKDTKLETALIFTTSNSVLVGCISNIRLIGNLLLVYKLKYEKSKAGLEYYSFETEISYVIDVKDNVYTNAELGTLELLTPDTFNKYNIKLNRNLCGFDIPNEK